MATKLIKLILKWSKHPLETIAVCLSLSTICYLSLIHWFQFHDSSLTTQTMTINSSSLLTDSKKRILLRQFIVDVPKFPVEVPPQGVLTKSVFESTFKLMESIKKVIVKDEFSIVDYEDLCARMNDKCIEFSPLSLWNNDSNQLLQDADLLQAVKQSNLSQVWFRNFDVKHVHDRQISSASSMVVSLFLNVTEPSQQLLVDQWEELIKNVKIRKLYPEYSASLTTDHSLFEEFLWKVREHYETSTSSDLLVQFISFVLMHLTFIMLFLNMRKVGSKFTLGFTVLTQGTCALLTSLVITKSFGIKMNIMILVECLPFLVVTIGFEKPFILTKAITMSDGSNVRQKVATGVSQVGPQLLKDYFIEILVLLLLGSTSGMAGGVKEFCFIAALILTFDCFYLFTMYLSVLVLKMEVQRMQKHDTKRLTSTNTKRVSQAKLILILTFLAMQALNASSSYQYYGDVDKVLQVNLHSPSTLQTLELLRKMTNDSLLIDIAAPFVLRPVKYDPDELENVPVVPFVDGLVAMVSKEVNIHRLLFGFVVMVLILTAYVLIKSDTKEEPPKRKQMIRNDSKFDFTADPKQLDDDKIVELVHQGKIAAYSLERTLDDCQRAVQIRRKIVSDSLGFDLTNSALPFEHYDYSKVLGVSCENVVGYLPIPVGVAGPLMVDQQIYQLPMATTEGCLVASTSRGCKAITMSGGSKTVVLNDGMARGPVVAFPSVVDAAKCKRWIEHEGYSEVEAAFNSTSRYAKLKHIKIAVAGKYLFARFVTITGDAMGMNMISKGTDKAIEEIQKEFPQMRLISISGNYCTDKKPAAVNWIEGRGKSVVAECVLPKEVIEKVLKTNVKQLVELNTVKNLIGSAVAGSIGGFNAHAANIVTAVFLATGQDCAQNVESSQCITVMESLNDGEELYISVTLPCLEVGTVGGGTALPAQSACLSLLGVKGPNVENPGENARQLARIIATGVMAGELSLCSALAAGHLVKSHMIHNRQCRP